jgi:endonuclease/exonuclease/phosphatase (EEP) superfamily protein YafD
LSASEITIVTVNARQQAKDMDSPRLEALASSIRTRRARDDGAEGPAPDVIVVNEMNPNQLVAFVGQLDGLYGATAAYAPAEASGKGRAKSVMNTKTIGIASAEQWSDVCEPKALFQIADLTHLGSRASFTMAAIHFSPRYPKGGDCRRANIEELRGRLGSKQGAVFIAGDFNKRCVEIERECDLEEESKPAGWWKTITKPSDLDGRSYEDAVKSYRRANTLPMADQWTHEQLKEGVLCDGSTGLKRSRIDFVFASSEAKIVEAGVDRAAAAQVYSDHRLVSCRFDLGA